MEAVVTEAGLIPSQLRVHLGHDAAALHHPAAGQPREQRRAAAADSGPQQALHQSAGRGEPKRHGWSIRWDHDGLW